MGIWLTEIEGNVAMVVMDGNKDLTFPEINCLDPVIRDIRFMEDGNDFLY